MRHPRVMTLISPSSDTVPLLAHDLMSVRDHTGPSTRRRRISMRDLNTSAAEGSKRVPVTSHPLKVESAMDANPSVVSRMLEGVFIVLPLGSLRSSKRSRTAARSDASHLNVIATSSVDERRRRRLVRLL